MPSPGASTASRDGPAGGSERQPVPGANTELRRSQRLKVQAAEIKGKPQEEDLYSWGERKDGETAEQLATRFNKYKREFEAISGKLKKLQHEVQGLKALLETCSRDQKKDYQDEIKNIMEEIKKLTARKDAIKANGGSMSENWRHQERFNRNIPFYTSSEESAEEGCRGKTQLSASLQQHSNTARSQGVNEQSPRGGQGKQRTGHESDASIPARQADPPLSGSSMEEESDSGGYLLSEIQKMEAPPDLSKLCFGNETPEEDTRIRAKGQAKKATVEVDLLAPRNPWAVRERYGQKN
ncbi:uncharacterized protein [Eleutherodactylus coqui]|uniref:uncharacterized protein isoform X1 n=1 Tax=Eleutherodactylus coqui TaxID=57060 RepID=UPI003461CF96